VGEGGWGGARQAEGPALPDPPPGTHPREGLVRVTSGWLGVVKGWLGSVRV